jgi:hypothetical protein
MHWDITLIRFLSSLDDSNRLCWKQHVNMHWDIILIRFLSSLGDSNYAENNTLICIEILYWQGFSPVWVTVIHYAENNTLICIEILYWQGFSPVWVTVIHYAEKNTLTCIEMLYWQGFSPVWVTVIHYADGISLHEFLHFNHLEHYCTVVQVSQMADLARFIFRPTPNCVSHQIILCMIFKCS